MYNVITLKHGTLYEADYVNKMYNMVKRNLTLPFTFYCVTDDPRELDKNIEIVMLPKDYMFKGWWCKPYLFKSGLFEHDVNFYIDLDMVIVDNIDCFMLYEPGKFVGLRNYIYLKTGYKKQRLLGSGVMRWQNNTMGMIHDRLQRDVTLADRFPGDQEYIWQYHKDVIVFYPDKWTISYKWHYVRTRNITNTKIIAFHGVPKPHESDDKNVVDNWK
jgi:hypothetical protein